MEDDEDEYILYGTPLPELEDEPDFRKKAAKELQVRDEKGRQRFHGAFTGGFSAGYFNTVGTKEGWAPSTFVSSRSKTADRIQQNPEDFMDDEDFGDFGIATRKIHTTAHFQGTSDSSSIKRKYITSDSVIPGEAPLKDIVRPVRESIGILILKKLGWKQGQGIGPRVKKQTSVIKIYGCSPVPDTTIQDEHDPFAETLTFAPKDTEEMLYKPKDNYFGLGYSGLSKQSVLTARTDEFASTSTKSWLAKDKKKLTISGQAFGVGAYEEEDEDIYARDDMSQYDFSDLVLSGSGDSKKATDSRGKEKTHDVIEGFCLASQPPSVKKYYPPPELPRNFNPTHLKQIKKQSEIITLSKSRHTLSAFDRSLILGEKKLVPPSIAVATIPIKGKSSDLKEHAKPFTSASDNFRPFSSDLPKQQRYEEYLKLKKTGATARIIQPSSMTEWEKQQEIEEFAKASVFFQPLSNALKSRFESGSHLSVTQEVKDALEKIKKEKEGKPKTIAKRNMVGSSNRKTFEWRPVSLLCRRLNVPNPYPDSNSSGTLNSQKLKSVFDHLSSGNEASGSQKTFSPSPNSNKPESEIKATEDKPNEVPQENPQLQDTSILSKNKEDAPAENKRPPIDFFKDIFENSSSDEDDNPDREETVKLNEKVSSETEAVIENNNISLGQSLSLENNKDIDANKKVFSKLESFETQSVATKSKKVGFGVFANLDLDALNQRPPPKTEDHQTLKLNESLTFSAATNSNNQEQSQSKSNDTYGPELPPNFSNVESSSRSMFRMEETKHIKHKSKHKHHKHKNKKKKKKKSSKRESSYSDSEEELKDIPPSLIIEKLKKLQRMKS